MNSEMEEIIIPYIRIDQVKKFIKDFPAKSCRVDELINKFGRSNVANALPTLQLLKLIEYNKKERLVSLTDAGNGLRIASTTNDDARAREIIRPIIDELELFKFIKGLLERKGILTSEEIGKELAFRYKKTWNNPVTYKAYGAACASILAFAGYGTYERGILRKGEHIAKEEAKLPSPYLSFKKILKILNEIKYEEIDIHALSERLQTKQNRLSAELSVCIELGLVERIVAGKFSITQKGKELIDPTKIDVRPEIWRDLLLESRYKRIIRLLKDRTFTIKELGEILNHHLGGKWREEKTIRTFAKKFWSWLQAAELIEKSEDNRYKFSEKFKLPEKKEIVTGIALIDYYSLGKCIGIISSSQKFEEIKDAVSKLISICKHEKSLEDMVGLIEDHYKLFLDLKMNDGRIFLPDIKLLEKKLGVEKWNIESIK
mgnify:CR=1 FL=1